MKKGGKKMKAATSIREKIKAAEDILFEDIPISQWDVTVRVQTMSGLERAKLLSTCLSPDGEVIQSKFQIGLLVSCCKDPDTGEPIFQEDDEWLLEKSSGAIERLASAAMRVSGLTRAALEEAEKNS
jgi:hypothetical protein